MLSTEQDPSYLEWAGKVLNASFGHGCKVLTNIGDDGSIRAVVVYHRFSETNCEMAIASDGTGTWMTRQSLRLAFGYPFIQLQLSRVTAVVEAINDRSIRLVKHLGFHEEGMLRDWFGAGRNGILFGMIRNDCRWTDGKRRK